MSGAEVLKALQKVFVQNTARYIPIVKVFKRVVIPCDVNIIQLVIQLHLAPAVI